MEYMNFFISGYNKRNEISEFLHKSMNKMDYLYINRMD